MPSWLRVLVINQWWGSDTWEDFLKRSSAFSGLSFFFFLLFSLFLYPCYKIECQSQYSANETTSSAEAVSSWVMYFSMHVWATMLSHLTIHLCPESHCSQQQVNHPIVPQTVNLCSSQAGCSHRPSRPCESLYPRAGSFSPELPDPVATVCNSSFSHVHFDVRLTCHLPPCDDSKNPGITRREKMTGKMNCRESVSPRHMSLKNCRTRKRSRVAPNKKPRSTAWLISDWGTSPAYDEDPFFFLLPRRIFTRKADLGRIDIPQVFILIPIGRASSTMSHLVPPHTHTPECQKPHAWDLMRIP